MTTTTATTAATATAATATAGIAIAQVLSDTHGWNTHDGRCQCGWRVTATEGHPEHQTVQVLAALAEAGLEVKHSPPGRWGFYLEAYPDHVYERYGEDSARRGASVADGRVVVHWPHGGTGWQSVP